MPPVIQPRVVAREVLKQVNQKLPHALRDAISPLLPLPVTPTKTSQIRRFATLLVPRQQQQTPSSVPGGYGSQPNGPDTGTVVGIVLGSVGGFLLLLWLIYTCMNFGNPNVTAVETASVGDASEVTRRSRRSRRHSHNHHSHKHHSPARRETVEVRTSTRQVPQTTERIVMEERSRSRGPPPMAMPMPAPPPPPAPIIDDDDEVVVIEEHTPSRRRHSRRRSSERRRPSSGYRRGDY